MDAVLVTRPTFWATARTARQKFEQSDPSVRQRKGESSLMFIKFTYLFAPTDSSVLGYLHKTWPSQEYAALQEQMYELLILLHIVFESQLWIISLHLSI